ncbi:MAG: Carbohydrate-binding protein [Nitrospira sp.]
MRKHFIDQPYSKMALPDPDWLRIEHLADVEVTSEDPTTPVENAFLPDRPSGWRAGVPGRQIIRLVFNRPLTIRRIRLRFAESILHRTQEYTLRWSASGAPSFRDIVRQQWNFSPQGSTSEIEDHYVELIGAIMLELNIIPDVSGEPATASLLQWRIG